MTTIQVDAISKRLDAIIYLLVRQNSMERQKSVSEIGKELTSLGLDLDVTKHFGDTGSKVRWGHQ